MAKSVWANAKRVWQLAAAIALLITTAFLVLDILLPNQLSASEARRELLSLYAQVDPGDSREAVEATFARLDVEHLHLRKPSADLWIFQTPLLVGASNWDLWVEFTGPVVETVYVRSADSKSVRPSGAPPDKVARSQKATPRRPTGRAGSPWAGRTSCRSALRTRAAIREVRIMDPVMLGVIATGAARW